MGKYDPLHDYLLGVKTNRWKANFNEIEKILGAPLPKSARDYPAWWANQTHGPQCSSWLKAGWITSDLNLGSETVILLKDISVPMKNKSKNFLKGSYKPLGLSKFHSWDITQSIDCRVEMKWEPAGIVWLDKNAKLAFPKGEDIPGIYRFRIRKDGKESLYVGETDNLRRRFGNYRSPGQSQQTNVRINAAFKKALAEGAEISVSVIVKDAWIHRGNERQSLNLSSKVIRCLLENLTILDGGASDIENLNRAKV